jgi:hypothetical protein
MAGGLPPLKWIVRQICIARCALSQMPGLISRRKGRKKPHFTIMHELRDAAACDLHLPLLLNHNLAAAAMLLTTLARLALPDRAISTAPAGSRLRWHGRLIEQRSAAVDRGIAQQNVDAIVFTFVIEFGDARRYDRHGRHDQRIELARAASKLAMNAGGVNRSM